MAAIAARTLPLLTPLAVLLSGAQLSAQSVWTCSSDILFEGSQETDHCAWSIDTNGNWNEDAYTGGVPMNDILTGGYQPGVALGSAELFLTVEEDSLGADLGFPINVACPFSGGRVRIEGQQDYDLFGYAVAFIGDIDDDGRDDLAVTMVRGPRVGTVYTERGAVYVFLSDDPNPNGIPLDAPASGVTTVDAAEASLIIRGTTDGYRFGRSIAGIGDWEGDGDGVPDFLVGAPGDDTFPGTFGGLVYMISGDKVLDSFRLDLGEVDVTAVLVDDELEPESLMLGVIAGDSVGDRMGFSVAHIGEGGDTGHGSDFAVGAPQFNDPDELFVSQFDNSDNPGAGYVKVFLGAGAHPIVLNGTQSEERFGFSLAGRADVDGDVQARDEVLVGSPFWDVSGHTYPNAGKVTVFTAFSSTVIDVIEGDDAPLPNRATQERLGFGVSGLGDLSGGGGDEFCVGSFGFMSVQTGSFNPPSLSPCDPCPKIVLGAGAPLGGLLSGRAQVVSYNGTSLSTVMTYVGDFRDSAGSALAFLPHAGSGADPAVVVGASRWGDDDGKKEVGRFHLFLW